MDNNAFESGVIETPSKKTNLYTKDEEEKFDLS